MKKKETTAVAVRENTLPTQQMTPDQVLCAILDVARTPGVDITIAERLFAMQRQMVADQAKSKFDDSMAIVQSKLKPIVQYGQGKNNKYVPYEDILVVLAPLLAEEGMSISFSEVEKPNEKQTKFVLKVSKSGHTESYFRTFADDIASRNSRGDAIRPAIQDDGSTSSYAQRYMVKMAFNIAEKGADNDGENLEKIGPGQCAEIVKLLHQTGSTEAEFLRLIAKTEKLEDILVKDFTRVMNPLQTKLREKSKNSGTPAPVDNLPAGAKADASKAKAAEVIPASGASAAPGKRPDPTKDWVDNSGPKKPEKLTEKLLKQIEAAKTIQALQLIGEQCKTAPEGERKLLREVYAARMKQLQTESLDEVTHPSDLEVEDDGDLVCSPEQQDELTGIRMDREIPPAKWFAFVKGVLGYAKSADLRRKDFQRARAWCEASGKE